MLVDVRANGPAAQTESRLGRLISACRVLGQSAFWGNDVLEGVSKKGGWRVNLLAQDATLCGFVVYRFDADKEKIEVAYLAVSPSLRGQGCGRALVRWVQAWAQAAITRSRAAVVCCACVPEAVGFYQRLGFRRTKPIEAQDEQEAECLIPGQFLMIWKIPPISQKVGRKN
jgi:ribosomal protein S18 acetylase RimI-like enzyme